MPLDHEYVFTIAGRCGRHGCEQVADMHPKFNHSQTADECNVDHRSINVQRLYGDEGEQWTSCPVCGVQIEPVLPEDTSGTGRRLHSRYGPGRLPFTQRHWDEMSRIKAAFEAGYYQS